MKSHHPLSSWIFLSSSIWTISHAYVTTNQHKWLSIPAEFGKSLGNKEVMANLHLPPRDLDPQLCTMYNFDDDYDTPEDVPTDDETNIPEDAPVDDVNTYKNDPEDDFVGPIGDDFNDDEGTRHLKLRRRRMERTLGNEGDWMVSSKRSSNSQMDEGYLRKRFAKGDELSNMISYQKEMESSKNQLPIALIVER